MFHERRQYFRAPVCSLAAHGTIIGDYVRYQIKLKDGTSFLAAPRNTRATGNYLLVTIIGLRELRRRLRARNVSARLA